MEAVFLLSILFVCIVDIAKHEITHQHKLEEIEAMECRCEEEIESLLDEEEANGEFSDEPTDSEAGSSPSKSTGRDRSRDQRQEKPPL